MNKQEFIKKYRGATPDPHNRTPWKRWEDIEKDMEKDLDELISKSAMTSFFSYLTEDKIISSHEIDDKTNGWGKFLSEESFELTQFEINERMKSFKHGLLECRDHIMKIKKHIPEIKVGNYKFSKHTGSVNAINGTNDWDEKINNSILENKNLEVILREESPLPHQCRYCGKSFATPDELYDHQEKGLTDKDECSQLG